MISERRGKRSEPIPKAPSSLDMWRFLALVTAFALSESNSSRIEDGIWSVDLIGGDVAGGLRRFKLHHGRTALIPDRYYGLWPDGFVFYELDEITSTIEPLIQEAMEEFENYTCIRFLKRNGNPNINNYLFIRGDAIGCWSYMGMNELGPQDLSIEMGQCDRKGIIMHELMHSLGFYHEHVRFDRDEYVKVHWENISPGREEEFYAVTLNDSQDLGVEYSFESIMHPELTVFTGNGRLTLEPIGEWAGTDPGPLWAKGRLAPSDIVQIDRLYECSDDGSSTRS